MHTVQHFIDGKTTEATSGRFASVTNPATGEVTARVALADASEVDTAVTTAAKAFETWSTASLAKRTQVLFAYREAINAHRDEIAELITAEHGKVHSDALGEVARGLEIVELACGIPQLLKGEASTQVSTGVDVKSLRRRCPRSTMDAPKE